MICWVVSHKRKLSGHIECKDIGIFSSRENAEKAIGLLKTKNGFKDTMDATWGDTIYTDFSDYAEQALKFCVEIFDDSVAKRLADYLSDCDCLKFSGTEWYKFTKKEATKENAILKACEICGIALEDVTAFGDDAPDIGMLKLCGTGVAMGNAIDSVKEAADIVIGSNDQDGIAKYLEQRNAQ